MAKGDALGKRLLHSLLKEQNLNKLVEGGVSIQDISYDAKSAYDWTENFMAKWKKWPTAKQVMEGTGIVFSDGDPDDLEYVCDLVRKRSLAKGIDSDLRPALKNLENRDPDEALRLIGEIALRRRRGQANSTRSFRKDGLVRYEEYQEAQKTGLPGVPTPWGRLDREIQCWVNGTLNVVVAMQNTGKTWSCCLFSNHALSLGYKVLFVSMEMSTVRIERRVDAMHYKIPFGDLRDTEVELFQELDWQKRLDENSKSEKGDIIFADKQLVRYVSDVNALVLEHKPDLVVIDGGYRFESRKGSGDWESAKQIVADLQTTAENTAIPWIVTTQQGETPPKQSKLDSQERAFKVKYAKEWVINPDIVIEMYCNADLRLLKSMEWILLKDRDAKDDQRREPFQTHWDLTNMVFDEMFEESADDTGSVNIAAPITY